MDILERKVSAHSHMKTLSGFINSAFSIDLDENLKRAMRVEYQEAHEFLLETFNEMIEVINNQREVIDGLREENTALASFMLSKDEVNDG